MWLCSLRPMLVQPWGSWRGREVVDGKENLDETLHFLGQALNRGLGCGRHVFLCPSEFFLFEE